LLLDNNYFNTKAIIILPSFHLKIFPNSSIAFPNFVGNELVFFQRPKGAGFYINRGKKPQVRGTVKNSCDHPNGGRSRALKCSKTP